MVMCTTRLAQPTGLRPATVSTLRSSITADGFAGLPAGVTRWRLAAALRAAARLLDLSAPMLRLLEYYIDCTYDIDWTVGNEPVITRPLTETATSLNRSERQIRNIERSLAERGLLAWRDSANHHRRGQRDRRTGRLLHAYGPTLAPLAARTAEILALAGQARAELAALRRSRLAIGALRRRLRCAMAIAPAGPAAQDEALKAINRRLPARLSLAELEQHREQLRKQAEAFDAMISGNDPKHDAETAHEGEIFSRPDTDTKTGKSIKEYDELATNHGNEEPHYTTLSLMTVHDAAGPTVRALMEGNRTWSAMIRAAQQSAPLVGLDAHLWHKGCEMMGTVQTALAVLVMERASLRDGTSGWPPLRHPTAYFRTILQRHSTGTLQLERSIRHLAKTGTDTMRDRSRSMRGWPSSHARETSA